MLCATLCAVALGLVIPAVAAASAGAGAETGTSSSNAATSTAGAPSATGTPSTSSSAAPSAVTAKLSNLKTDTRWAYPQSAAPARAFPAAHAKVVGYLHFLTPDGQAEVYLELRSYTLGAQRWIEVEIPGRPNGKKGWVSASDLGEGHLLHEYLRVNRETLKIDLYRDGRVVWSAPVGVGRPSLPTPAGHFYVTEKLQAIGGPFYGPYALGTSAYAPTLSEWPGGGVVGIHGTDEPELIPGYPSHGCIRLRNGDVSQLYRLVEVGTPIEIV